MAEKTDEQLVVEIQEGNLLSFEILVRRYQNRVIGFVNRIVFDSKTAEEVAQDAFLKTYKKIDKINTQKKFSTFLFEVAKNTAIDYWRKKKKEISLSENFSVVGASVEEKIDVQEALAKLPENYKKIVGLYYFSGLSYEEISKKLRIPINTVRTHLRRAKLKLKELLT